MAENNWQGVHMKLEPSVVALVAAVAVVVVVVGEDGASVEVH